MTSRKKDQTSRMHAHSLTHLLTQSLFSLHVMIYQNNTVAPSHLQQYTEFTSIHRNDSFHRNITQRVKTSIIVLKGFKIKIPTAGTVDSSVLTNLYYAPFRRKWRTTFSIFQGAIFAKDRCRGRFLVCRCCLVCVPRDFFLLPVFFKKKYINLESWILNHRLHILA